MPGIILLGTQWGDEGKGRVTDLLASDMDMVIRFQGGNNAGTPLLSVRRSLNCIIFLQELCILKHYA